MRRYLVVKRLFLALAWVVLAQIALRSAPAISASSVYYIASSGNDSNPGTITQPWKTIQKAADTMVAGDKVYVRGGTYANGVSLTRSGSAGAYITYQAYPGEQPIVKGSGWYGFSDYYGTSGTSYTVIDGFEFDGTGYTDYEFGLHFQHSNNLIFRNNKVHDMTLLGINVVNSNTGEISGNTVHDVQGYNGIWGGNVSNYSIHNNTVYRNNQNGIGVSGGTTNTSIYDNTAYGNSCGQDQRYAGIAIEVSSQNNKVYNNLMYNNCHAGYVTNSPSNQIYNNTFYGNTGYQVLYGPWSGSIPVNNIFENNVFVVVGSGDIGIGDFGDTSSYNPLQNTFNYNAYYYMNGPDKSNMVAVVNNYSFSQWRGIGKEANGILGNPLFVNAPAGNFRLQKSSPVIDKGANVGVSVDSDGNPRPEGAGYDIGAYEYATAVVRSVFPSYLPLVLR
ncbi:MAG: right-handed parallel beta-helix repeat-containing protein [Chloroflexi bacterium]|nr:right-handed parallel beta-helix repeat-containing protein [Chloroflexota bacterium]